jgi:ATP synthase protein I
MNEIPNPLSIKIGPKAARKIHARRNSKQGIWFGLGTMGLIGWSIVVPTLIGAALGRWLDKNFSSQHSWTLALLIAGLALGCVQAWHWVATENKTINEEQESDDERNS